MIAPHKKVWLASQFELRRDPGSRPSLESERRIWDGTIWLFASQQRMIELAIAKEEVRQDNMRRFGLDRVAATGEALRREGLL